MPKYGSCKMGYMYQLSQRVLCRKQDSKVDSGLQPLLKSFHGFGLDENKVHYDQLEPFGAGLGLVIVLQAWRCRINFGCSFLRDESARRRHLCKTGQVGSLLETPS
jgi:hypothetical protein